MNIYKVVAIEISFDKCEWIAYGVAESFAKAEEMAEREIPAGYLMHSIELIGEASFAISQEIGHKRACDYQITSI